MSTLLTIEYGVFSTGGSQVENSFERSLCTMVGWFVGPSESSAVIALMGIYMQSSDTHDCTDSWLHILAIEREAKKRLGVYIVMAL